MGRKTQFAAQVCGCASVHVASIPVSTLGGCQKPKPKDTHEIADCFEAVVMGSTVRGKNIMPAYPLVIAEIGNCHEGNLEVALELVERAREAGADFAKFQAGTAVGFARLPEDVERYKKYELGKAGYLKLAWRAWDIGIIPMFSIWGEGFDDLMMPPFLWRKIAARQCTADTINRWQSPETFISIPHWFTEGDILALNITTGIPMHCVTEYPATDPMLNRILKLAQWTGLPAGFSDHTIGIENAITAVKQAHAIAIEKHFTLSHDFGPLRDHQLAATPSELKALVEAVKS